MANYVAEVWIDPAWYELQDPPETLPSLTPPRIISLTPGRHTIGRATSRPTIDCGLDSGVSRTHAELVIDETGCTINDQGSANGTYVADATAALPKISITRPTLVGPEHRIYLGCWTRIVVREAVPSETI